MISIDQYIANSSKQAPQVLEPAHCKKHGDYMARQIVPASHGRRALMSRCQECETERRAKEQARAEKLERMEKTDKLKKLFGEAGTNFDGASFDDYVVEHDHQREVVRLCKAYARNFDKALKSHTCLIFAGNTGTGKNHLALSIANEITRKGYTACYIRLLKLIAEARPDYKETRSGYDKIEAFALPDLLIVDEVGLKTNTETEAALLNEVFGVREANSKPTIFISNLRVRSDNPAETTVASILGSRIMDRMTRGGGRELIFNWPSYRKNLKSTGVFDDE